MPGREAMELLILIRMHPAQEEMEELPVTEAIRSVREERETARVARVNQLAAAPELQGLQVQEEPVVTGVQVAIVSKY
jgi:hypothetical protein